MFSNYFYIKNNFFKIKKYYFNILIKNILKINYYPYTKYPCKSINERQGVSTD
jgi:hypothetical protein